MAKIKAKVEQSASFVFKFQHMKLYISYNGSFCCTCIENHVSIKRHTFTMIAGKPDMSYNDITMTSAELVSSV